MTSEEVKQLKPEENEVSMEELEKNARELILDITKKTLKTLEENGLLKEPSSLQNLSFSSPEMRAFLEKIKAPKYDPCRRFKKGDKVEYSPRDGRDCLEAPWIYDEAEVIEDEDKNGSVVVRFTFNYGEPAVHKVQWYYLQLVTPVEERSPYCVKETASVYEVFNRNENNSSVAIFFKSQYSIEKAKERADAECARLNAEYGKEQA